MSTYAIGDTHGCVHTLRKLVDMLNPADGDTLVFLGDYIDRGPDSKGVIDFVMALQEDPRLNVVALRGNHEDMCLAYFGRSLGLGKNDEMNMATAFAYNGGKATICSFNPAMESRPYNVTTDLVPDKYLDWMAALPYRYEDEHAHYVHAGFKPYVEPKDQDPYDMVWIRDNFLYHTYQWDKPVIHGHTPGKVGEYRPGRIGVDSGAVFGGQLSAYCVEAKVFYRAAKDPKDGTY